MRIPESRFNRAFAATAAGAALAAFAGSAEADVVNFGDHTLAGGEIASTPGFTSSGPLDNFTISFDYDETVADASWASDLQVVITDVSTGDTFTIGGFTNEGNADALWAFGGSGSTNPGFYSDTFNSTDDSPVIPLGDGGSYALTLANDWATDANANIYNNFSIEGATISAIPEPAAASVLGLGALALLRRRR